MDLKKSQSSSSQENEDQNILDQQMKQAMKQMTEIQKQTSMYSQLSQSNPSDQKLKQYYEQLSKSYDIQKQNTTKNIKEQGQNQVQQEKKQNLQIGHEPQAQASIIKQTPIQKEIEGRVSRKNYEEVKKNNEDLKKALDKYQKQIEVLQNQIKSQAISGEQDKQQQEQIRQQEKKKSIKESNATRVEYDTFGEIHVPANKY